MIRFRIFWLTIIGIVTAAFVAYNVMSNLKEDSTVPIFTIEEENLEVSIHDGEDVLKQGITAHDEKDGDVTDSILIETISDIFGEGQRTVTYVAFDADNHVSRAERTITYTDYTSPRFELTDSLRFRSGSSVNIDKIVKVQDCLDGDISNKVKIQMETSIINYIAGRYNIVYQVTNSAGDAVELPVQYEVYQADSNEVVLNLSKYLIYYEGEDIAYKDYLESVEVGRDFYYFEETAENDPEESEGTEGEGSEGAAGGAEGEGSEGAVGDAEDEDNEGTSSTDGEGTADGETTMGSGEDEAVQYVSRDLVTIRSYVDPETAGVYPVYFYYESERYVATEVMYVVVE